MIDPIGHRSDSVSQGVRNGSRLYTSESENSEDLDVKIYTSTPPPSTSTELGHQMHPSRVSILRGTGEHQQLGEGHGNRRSCDVAYDSIEVQQASKQQNSDRALNDQVVSDRFGLSALFWSEKQKKYCS